MPLGPARQGGMVSLSLPTDLHGHGAVHSVVLADEVGEPAGVDLGHLAQGQGRGLQTGEGGVGSGVLVTRVP